MPRSRLFWAVALGHMVNDFFMSAGPVILAFLSVSILPMSNTQIGLTVSASQLAGAVSQPGFGLWADRTGGRWLGAGGVAWTVSFFMVCLVGAQTGAFWLMFLPFVARALGSGAFHPVGSMHAADSDNSRSASNMAYFFLMGQLGLALGPAMTGFILDLTNPDMAATFTHSISQAVNFEVNWWGSVNSVFILGIIAFPVVGFMLTAIPNRTRYRSDREMAAAAVTTTTTPKNARLPVRGFLLLGLMVGLRSLGQPGSVTFIPVLFQDKGWTPAEYGAITSSFWIASGIAGVMFGNLADRIDRRLVVTGSMLSSAPAFFLLPLVDGPLAFVMAILAGGLSGGSHSIIVVLAQDMVPSAKAFASGSILGFIFAMAALGSFLIGTISDQIGLEVTFQLVAGLMAVAGVLALNLPSRNR